MGKRLFHWLGAAAVAALFSGSALAGIANTKHNLAGGTGSTAPGNKTSSTDQICVFCHTPHASDTTTPVPLWNKALPASTGYTVYSSDSMQGTADMTASASLVCLSCHDGSQAMDSTVNAPGQGLGSTLENGIKVIGAATNWSGTNQTSGKMNANTVAMLSKDLQNDHPIAIPYCGGGLSAANDATATTGSCNDGDFNAIKTAKIGSNQAFWIDVAGGTANSRQRTDISLYKREVGGTNVPYVECGSCHDPHVELAAPLVSFMRVTTAGSAICLACHNK